MKAEALIGEGLLVWVHFDYQPYEPPEPTYPGCEAEITINTVEVWGSPGFVDIMGALNTDCLAELETVCSKSIHGQEEDV